jgi:tRNA G10  N-methylase Trm11
VKESYFLSDEFRVSSKYRLERIEEKLSGKFRIYKGRYGFAVLGDAFEVLSLIKGIGVDAIITDPPFLTSTDGFMKKVYKGVMTDDIIFEIEDLLFEALKDNGWLVLYWSIKNLPRAFRFKRFQYVWTICVEFHSTYSKSVIGDRKWLPVLCFGKGQPKVVMRRVDIVPAEEIAVIQDKLKRPDFKPTFANSRLIQMFMPKDGLVLDPFAGWGSLPLVCEVFKRAWVAIEVQEERFNFMVKLIEDFNGNGNVNG